MSKINENNVILKHWEIFNAYKGKTEIFRNLLMISFNINLGHLKYKAQHKHFNKQYVKTQAVNDSTIHDK